MEGKEKRKGLGVRGWVLFGGGGAVILLILILLAGTASVDSFRFLGLDTLKRTTLAKLDPAVSPMLREELRRGFDCVIAGSTSGILDDEHVGRFARSCRRAAEDGRVTRAEAEALRELTRQFCARR